MQKSILTKKKPEKKLLKFLKKRAGRARSGRITVRHKGGGVKRLYRIIDFGQEKIGIPSKVIALEYDPYRTAFIALLEYQDGERRYILAPQDLRVGDQVIVSEKTELRPGNRMKLKNIPVGTLVYNIEIEPGRGGKLARGAGTAAKILAQEEKPSTRAEHGAGLVPHRNEISGLGLGTEPVRDLNEVSGAGFTHLEMPSGEIRKISQDCFASIGTVSHPEHIYESLGKAGKSRRLRRRPTVRGSAMNPPDHPHGGGEGKAPIGLKHPKTPWGKPARGVKTRRKRWTDKFIIQRRKKKK